MTVPPARRPRLSFRYKLIAVAYRLARSLSGVSRQQAEERLRESEERLYFAVRGSSDGIWDWDVARGRYHLSPRFKELLGYADDELPNERESFLNALHPFDRPRVEQAVRHHFETRVPYDIEYRLRCKDGGYRWFRTRGQAQWDKDGRVVRFSGASSDVTAQKLAEENMRALLAEKQAILDNALIGIWMARNRVIVSCNRRCEELFGYGPGEMIGQSVRIIYPSDETFEERGRRVYAILARGESCTEDMEVVRKDGSRFWCSTSGRAIDASSPLDGSIWIFADITDRKHIDDTGRNYLRRIRAGTQHMQQLIDDLLSLSRVTRDEMRRESVNLSRIAEQIMNELVQLSPERRVIVTIAPDLEVNGDANLLTIALNNLLRNAWKFTAKHETASIELGILHREGKPVYFVRDDGAGFDMRYATKLFAPFQRMHQVSDFEGTGIGLAIVNRIVQRHGGRIWAEAAIEQGATFYFTLT